MQGGTKAAIVTQQSQQPWSCPVDSTKTDYFGAKPKQQQQQSINGFSKSIMSSGSSKPQAESNPWGSTYKSRDNFVDMHLF